MLTEEYRVVALVENGQQFVDVATALDPDLAIVDISMPIMNGLEAVKQLKMRGSRTKVILFTVNANPAYVRRGFENGAMGYVIKDWASKDLPAAVKAVLDGETFISPSIQFSDRSWLMGVSD